MTPNDKALMETLEAWEETGHDSTSEELDEIVRQVEAMGYDVPGELFSVCVAYKARLSLLEQAARALAAKLAPLTVNRELYAGELDALVELLPEPTP